MLLKLIHEAVPWQGWDRWGSEHEGCLPLVNRIDLGATYDVVFHSGMTVVLSNLNALLDAVEVELAISPTIMLRVGRSDGGRKLVLTPCGGSGFRDIPLLLELIIHQCSTFNLSGEWDEQNLADYNSVVRTTRTLGSDDEDDTD